MQYAHHSGDVLKTINNESGNSSLLSAYSSSLFHLPGNIENVFSLNGRITYQGGDRYSPVNNSLSEKQQDVVYDESNPYSRQLSPVLLAHTTISYKINKKHLSHEFSAKLMNVTGYKEFYGHRYNYKTNNVEEERDALFMPNISYKIEF